jgi:hypothetical protein
MRWVSNPPKPKTGAREMIYGKELKSVGTYLHIDGMTFPINADGSADSDNKVHLQDIETDGDWMANLSVDDRKTVEAVLIWNN